MDFPTWAQLLVQRVRARLPDVTAVRRGQSVVLRYRDREARIACDRDCYRATFKQDDGIPTLPGIWFERLDDAGATRMAKTIAGHFDAALSRPD